MARDIVSRAAAELSALAAKTDSVLVAYSGGKDSLVVLDLCVRTFKRVQPFFMYMIPGLEVVERQLSYARQRWGLDVLRVPHWVMVSCLKRGVYCDSPLGRDAWPEMKLRDVYQSVMAETGIGLVVTGAKKAGVVARRELFGVA